MYVIDYLLGRSPTTAQAQTWPVGEPPTTLCLKQNPQISVDQIKL